MTKIKPTKRVPRFEKYNCSGKLRVDVKASKDNGLEEVILLPKKGGCECNLQLIGRLITLLCECNIDPTCIIDVLDATKPCSAPTSRMRNEKLPREEVGLGGCSKIILEAIKRKLDEISK